MQFEINGASYGSPAVLNGSSQASISDAALSVGSYTITAVYGGDTNFTGSDDTGSPLDQEVDQDSTTTTLSSSGFVLSLNGTNQYVDVGNPAALQLTGPMSITAWVSGSSFSNGECTIAGKWGDSGAGTSSATYST